MKTVTRGPSTSSQLGFKDNKSFSSSGTLRVRECMLLLVWACACCPLQVGLAESQRNLDRGIPPRVEPCIRTVDRQGKARPQSRSCTPIQWAEAPPSVPGLLKESPTRIKAHLHAVKTTEFVEVEIVLRSQFELTHISSLPRAPGSQLQVIDAGKRVRVQLPVSEVKDLVDAGANITRIREFVFLEGLRSDATNGGPGATLAADSSAYSHGENSEDADIPDDDDWIFSFILISDSPPEATVTSIDLHYEVTHPYVGDLVVAFTDESVSDIYFLWENEGGSSNGINETETGITTFNGKMANQIWCLCAKDTSFLDSGYIDYWWMKVYYESEGQGYDYWIQADSYSENTVEIPFGFYGNPGRVDFSMSPDCGSLEPVYAFAEQDPNTGIWWATTAYNPCESEGISVTITADPSSGSEQTKTVHLDERYHIGCGTEKQLGVSTCTPDPDDPTLCVPHSAEVNTTVIPSEAGTVSPSHGWSQYDPDCGLYAFWSTYRPTSSYAGRVRVRFRTSDSTVIYSFDQNAETIIPWASWQTISESFCTEGLHVNYYQVYKTYLYANKSYNFSLCDDDGIGGSCGGDGDFTMCDSSSAPLWYIDGDRYRSWDASTLGTNYEDWTPPLDGYYYLHVSNFDLEPMTYTLAYSGTVPDLNNDGIVNFKDFAFLVNEWPNKCSEPDWCGAADLDFSGDVNVIDLRNFIENWLEDTMP